jgi:hypothetical protein
MNEVLNESFFKKGNATNRHEHYNSTSQLKKLSDHLGIYRRLW